MAKKLDPRLRMAGERIALTKDQLRQYVRGSEDLCYFAEAFCSIQTAVPKYDDSGNQLDEPLRLIKLFDFQRRALLEMQRNKRFVFLCPRQQGKSTLAAIWIVWYAIYNDHREAVILSFRFKSAMDVMRRIQRIIVNLPRWLQKGVLKDGGWTNSKVEFEDEMRITAQATTEDSARGETTGLIYRDEDGFVVPRIAAAIDSATLPSLESDPNARLAFTSTPKGMNHFAQRWFDAVNGKNGYKAIRAFWWEFPGRDDSFKERMTKQLGRKRWQQEYECEFLGSSDILVDSEVLQRLHSTDPAKTEDDGNLRIYEEYQEGFKYVMGVDSAMGAGGDDSAFQVLKIESPAKITQVAAYSRNTIKPELYAMKIIQMSKRYGEADIMIENNPAGCGKQVADCIWFTYEYYHIVLTDKNRIGTFTTMEVKTSINLLLDNCLTYDFLRLSDAKTIEQLSYYEHKGGSKYAAVSGQHDDLVMALGMALYWFKSLACEFDMTEHAKMFHDKMEGASFKEETDN